MNKKIINLQKIGKWIELSDRFWNESQIIYISGYNLFGEKKGRWDIIYQGKEIGGRLYNEQEYKSIKIGKWIELSVEFLSMNQVIYIGEYNKNGKKVCRWNIYFKEPYRNQEYKQIEEWENLGYLKEVVYIGEYNNEGHKIGRWDILFRGQQIGGGEYNQWKGRTRKIGQWIDIQDEFWVSSQITVHDKYNLNGQKIDQWNTEYKGKIIGGGSYDQQDGYTKKIGSWIEFLEEFKDWNQITYNGEYNQQGIKIGVWAEIDIKKNVVINQSKQYN
ncbi:unnamed protein product [Paramecium sonneborni]|uniref:Uncharacterized protein n=1 Tax=Paramecium sonneborni TaxID=65129 RepID=A0A8S1QRA5_9CILI|nr:unnamed protein product [Paramecium sonneborni]